MSVPEKLVGTERVARELSCSGQHVRNLVRAGKLPVAAVVGRLLRFRMSEVREATRREAVMRYEGKVL